MDGSDRQAVTDMRSSILVTRGLRHHRRMHVAVALGVVVASATLTGALLVGDSMRGSLRTQALARLGRVEYALLAPRFFRAELAGAASTHSSSAAILLQGGIRHADSGARSNHAALIGVDEESWSTFGMEAPPSVFAGRVVALNETLSREVGAKVGDDLMINFANPSAISMETLLGRRDESALVLRVTVAAIIPDDAGGDFSLQSAQAAPRNAFLPLRTLQRALDNKGRVNALLFSSPDSPTIVSLDQWALSVTAAVILDDFGLRLRGDAERGYISLESDAMLLAPPVESAAREVAKELPIETSPVLTYLATGISMTGDDSRTVPYSVVAAIDPQSPAFHALRSPDGSEIPALQPGDILVNSWTAEQLGVKPGDRITLTYLMTGPSGRLDTRTTDFTLRGIVTMNDSAADPGFAPDYPGITDAKSLGDWNPPFPLDLNRIRAVDDVYWEKYRTAPKAFVALEEGQQLWVDQPERFGRLTAVRFHVAAGSDPFQLAAQLERSLRGHLKPDQFGLQFRAVRDDAIRAARGGTDFGMLFTGFSFFLIAAAAMLTALLFRLGVERRASEIGLLIAAGYRPRTVSRLLLTEGIMVSAVGVVVGLVAACAYAWLMLAGLRSWWSAAANAPFLHLHVRSATLAVGGITTFAIAGASLIWSVRGLTRRPPHRLLAGDASEEMEGRSSRGRMANTLALSSGVVAAALLIHAAWSPSAASPLLFFGVGAAALTAGLAYAYRRLITFHPTTIARSGLGAWTKLGLRNAPRHPGRSLLTLALTACAVFLIVSVGAFRIEPSSDPSDRMSGYGGFAQLAETAVSLPYDLNTAIGREALGLTAEVGAVLADVHIDAFRLRGGDETSCLSLYAPQEPRFLGAGDNFIQRGGFRFADSVATTDEQRANPWQLLNEPLADGAVPVIGDEAAVRWQLKRGLGQELIIRDQRGVEVPLRFVALLSGSVLQSEIIMSESSFTRLFPAISGHGFFLISTPPQRLTAVEQSLEIALERYSFDVSRTTERLASYVAVQNTYLGTFQTLGGLGLILGSAGLGVVMLRNVAERRGELALLRALGYTKRALGWMVISENALLSVGGLAAGVIPALVAIAPQLLDRPQAIPWLTLGTTLLGVLIIGLASGLAALRATLRAPLLGALRQE